jgi:hypothetical protein
MVKNIHANILGNLKAKAIAMAETVADYLFPQPAYAKLA